MLLFGRALSEESEDWGRRETRRGLQQWLGLSAALAGFVILSLHTGYSILSYLSMPRRSINTYEQHRLTFFSSFGKRISILQHWKLRGGYPQGWLPSHNAIKFEYLDLDGPATLWGSRTDGTCIFESYLKVAQWIYKRIGDDVLAVAHSGHFASLRTWKGCC